MTYSRLDDADLLRLARVQPDVIGVLYQRHGARVYRYLARRVGPSSAEDLLGEVFLAAVEARLRVVPHASGSALPWLYGIAANVVRVHRRRTEPDVPSHGSPCDLSTVDWDAVDSRLDAGALAGELRRALGSLSPDDRELLLLVAWEGLSAREAAQALGISHVAIRSRLHRARERAKRALDSPARVVPPSASTTQRSTP